MFVLKLCEKNSSVNIRFKILLRLSGPENVSGPSRNGPLDIFPFFTRVFGLFVVNFI